ncbi:MAG: tyrosine-type recombinase/integrase [Thioclava marina]|uniref:DUF6538 domain-containing protein n=1 Tax=Thioclava marina TaxID=1915077 RepID=UPI0019B9387D|nr:DUF6538 domain-containing protein [Thioclava marina]MBC7145523.1 tyrosine-type recombinase/integrase [Thioclava marina]
MNITKRGEVWHLRRRVPKAYAPVDPRREVVISLRTGSEAVARQKAPLLWDRQVETWEALLDGATGDAEARFAAAKRLAKAQGYRFLDSSKVARLPVQELLARIELTAGDEVRDPLGADSLLGGAELPLITVSRALELFWGLARDKTLGKSADQIRRWRYPHIKAVQNFISVVGDKPLSDLTIDDFLDFRDWWAERLEREGLTANSANKDLTHLGAVLKRVNRDKRLGLKLPLEDLSFRQGRAARRPPFSDDWIRDQLLAPGALDDLEPQARAILLVMVNTGLRPSEIAALRPEEIRLDDPIPHLLLQPIGRVLKTQNAERVMPLLGVSFEAMRAFPEGFSRYRESSATLSATVNTYLRDAGLLESERHSLYSLRHALEDRMLAAEVDERIRRDVMGHALGRERYGAGGRLATIAQLLAPIAF